MAVPTLRFIPTSGDGSTPQVNVDEIPEDLKAQVEEVYAALKGNSGRMRAEFATVAELTQYRTLLISYCAQRTVVVDGNTVKAPLKFRKSPTKGLPETIMEYRITDLPAEETPANPATPAAPAADAPKSTGKAKK